MAAKYSTAIMAACVAMAMLMTSATKRMTSNEELLARLEATKRDSKCTGAAGKCFNTAHCCSGLICATFDEDIGDKPEVPGNCVKSKDLQACGAGRAECPEGSECVALGRTGQKYCVHHGSQGEEGPVDEGEQGVDDKQLGGLGATCVTSKDCQEWTENRSIKLCCQQVRRGRQGIKRLCDRVTPISICLAEP